MALLAKVQTSVASCSRRGLAFRSAAPSRTVYTQRSSVVVRIAQPVDIPGTLPPLPEEADPNELSNIEQDPDLLKLPQGVHWYETMLVLKATLTDDERDKELAKFEAFLNKEGCQSINALVRPRQRMAYPMKGNWESMYVLYTYAASRQTARKVQLLLSNPEAGSEDRILRHVTFCKY